MGTCVLGSHLQAPPHASLLAPQPLPQPLPADFTSPSPPVWEWCQGEKGTLAQTMCVWEFPPTVEPREGVPVSPRSQWQLCLALRGRAGCISLRAAVCRSVSSLPAWHPSQNSTVPRGALSPPGILPDTAFWLGVDTDDPYLRNVPARGLCEVLGIIL